MGGGYCELVESEDRLDEVMDKVHRRIGTPLLTHLQVRAAGVELLPDTWSPARLPDLFAGTPLRIPLEGFASGAIDRIDTFTDHTEQRLDILIMLDNSASMEAERLALANNFGAFFTSAAVIGVDYQLAVTTADISSVSAISIGPS